MALRECGLCGLGLGTLVLLISLFPALLLGISSLAIGGGFMNSCPRQHMIPLWLVINGCIMLGVVSLILFYLLFFSCSLCGDKQGGTAHGWLRYCGGVGVAIGIGVGFLFFGWHIAGSVWIFSVHSSGEYQHENPEKDDYCHPTPFMAGFVILIIQFILIFCTPCLKFTRNKDADADLRTLALA